MVWRGQVLEEARFDVLKLIPADWAALPPSLPLPLAQLLAAVPVSGWAGRAASLGPLITAYTHTPRPALHQTLGELLHTALLATRAFTFYPAEPALWLQALPVHAPPALVRAFEAIVATTTAQLYALLDRTATLATAVHAQLSASTDPRTRIWAAVTGAGPAIPLVRPSSSSSHGDVDAKGLVRPAAPFSPLVLAAVDAAYRPRSATASTAAVSSGAAADTAAGRAALREYVARVVGTLAMVGPANALFLHAAVAVAAAPIGRGASGEEPQAATVFSTRDDSMAPADADVARLLHTLSCMAGVRPPAASSRAQKVSAAPRSLLHLMAATAAPASDGAGAEHGDMLALQMVAAAERIAAATNAAHPDRTLAAAGVLQWLTAHVAAAETDAAGAEAPAAVPLAFRLLRVLDGPLSAPALAVGGTTLLSVRALVALHPLVVHACLGVGRPATSLPLWLTPVTAAAVRAQWALWLASRAPLSATHVLAASPPASLEHAPTLIATDPSLVLRTPVLSVLLAAAARAAPAPPAEAATLFNLLRRTYAPTDRASLLGALLHLPDTALAAGSPYLPLVLATVGDDAHDPVEDEDEDEDDKKVVEEDGGGRRSGAGPAQALAHAGPQGLARLAALYVHSPSAALEHLWARLLTRAAPPQPTPLTATPGDDGAPAPMPPFMVPAAVVGPAMVKTALGRPPTVAAGRVVAAALCAQPAAVAPLVARVWAVPLIDPPHVAWAQDVDLAYAYLAAAAAVPAAVLATAVPLSDLLRGWRDSLAQDDAAAPRVDVATVLTAWHALTAAPSADAARVGVAVAPPLLAKRVLPPPCAEEDDAGRAARAGESLPVSCAWRAAEVVVVGATAAADRLAAALGDGVIQRSRLVDRADTRWRWQSGWMLLAALAAPRLPAPLHRALPWLMAHDAVVLLEAGDRRPALEHSVLALLGMRVQ
jgi:hypothetical protein